MRGVGAALLVLAFLPGVLPVAAKPGDVEWVRRVVRPQQDYGTHVVTGNGGVYVLGYWTSFDYPYPASLQVVKYSAAGGTTWTQGFGPAGGSASPKDLALDSKGNAFILAHYNEPTGQLGSYLVLKLSGADGKVDWTRTVRRPGDESWSEEALAVDSDGNVYIAGSSRTTGVDFLVTSFGPTGKPRWTRHYNGPGNGDDRAQDIVATKDAVYVAGFSWGGGSDDWAVVKYTTGGALKWTRRVDAGYRVAEMALDTSGNVVLAGTATGINVGGKYTNDDYLVAKFTADGKASWTRRYNAPAFGNDRPVDVATGPNGMVAVSGTAGNAGGWANYLTVVYDSAGGRRWVKQFNGPGGAGDVDDVATGVAVNTAGEVFVTGRGFTGAAPRGYFDYYTLKYGTTGKQVWVRLYNRVPQQQDGAEAIALDADGVYVTGGGWQDMVTIKYEQ